ncbi:MAG: MBOAT family O-acyltransferase [Bacteroidota bacterium]|nr:MBOAT family O-acyltransferase [Bacteroidota bacterium]
MLFSSLIFLYTFLPIVLLLYYFADKKYQNKLLLIASLVFFAWGGVSYTLILISSLIINYISGVLINKFDGKSTAKVILTIGIILNLATLGVFKYASFVVENLNYLINLYSDYKIDDPGIILPLGISFYTFQAMSYIIDVYRKEAEVQKNFFKLALYISFFPQLIAGPIVRYQNIADQLTNRKKHLTNLSFGIQRFALGLGKKVLLANQFGLVADKAFSLPVMEINSSTAWIGVLAYTMQIYFDFSGYSDMAIGLGRMFGFNLPENFNFPYMAKSMREFWQRWHITLSVWFKNYLYFPLGGSKKGKNRTIINLLIIFFATSIWHGASWNFVIWGMTHGVFMMLERLGLGKIIEKMWRPFQHIYAMLIIIVTRVFFKADTFDYAWGYFTELFTFNFNEIHFLLSSDVLNIKFLIVSIIGILSSTHFWLFIEKKLNSRIRILNNELQYHIKIISNISISFIVAFSIILCTMMLLNDSYNPFIYFRF